MIDDVNTARYKWLMARNPDLVHECEWRLKQLIEMTGEDLTGAEDKSSTNFLISVNNEIEKTMIKTYIEGLGYKFAIGEAWNKIIVTISLC